VFVAADPDPRWLEILLAHSAPRPGPPATRPRGPRAGGRRRHVVPDAAAGRQHRAAARVVGPRGTCRRPGRVGWAAARQRARACGRGGGRGRSRRVHSPRSYARG
jgi:hypothetical protein